jgi:hypothetical protein
MDVPIGGIDKPVWTLVKSGVFTCAETWMIPKEEKGGCEVVAAGLALFCYFQTSFYLIVSYT